MPGLSIRRPANRQKPRDIGVLASGAHLSLVGYTPAVDAKLDPKTVTTGGVPALHFTITTAMMGQHFESWLLADDPQHGSFSMGLANIELKRGVAPKIAAASSAGKVDSPNRPGPNEETEIEESIFAFTKAPEEQIAKVAKGGSTGAKIQLPQPQNGNKGSVVVSLAGKSWTLDVADNLKKEIPLEGSPFTLRMKSHWPRFSNHQRKARDIVRNNQTIPPSL